MITTTIKGYLFLSFLLLTKIICAQPLTLKWLDKQPEAFGQFIKSDSKGNVISVGTGTNFFGAGYILVLKYDSIGNLLWSAKSYTNSVDCQISPRSVQIDSYDNIYIAGINSNYCSSSSYTPNGILLKYNSTGTLLWNKVYGSNAGLWIEYWDMRIFEDKYIYVCGKSYLLGTTLNYNGFVARYDSSGNLNWTNTLNNSYDTYNLVVEVDKVGNLYAGGTTACCLPGYDMNLYKCDSLGNIKWNTTILDTGFAYAQPSRIAIDDSANVFLIGESLRNYMSNGHECAIAKIDSTGNKKWFSVYTGSATNNDFSSPFAAFTDKEGCCYVVGVVSYVNTGNNNAFAIQISPNGIIGWDNIYNGGGNGDNGYLNGFMQNDSTLIAAGGGVFNGGTQGLVLRSYSSNGAINWTYENPNDCYAFAAVQSASTIYCTGIFDGTQTGVDDSLMNCRLDLNIGTGIPKMRSVFFPSIYPNPFSSQIIVDSPLNKAEKTSINIYNTLGELIYQNVKYETVNIINTTEWKNGLYILEIIGAKKNYRKKIVKN